MWSVDVMNLIEKEFPFVKFSPKSKENDLWAYEDNNVIINIGDNLIGILIMNPVSGDCIRTYVINEGCNVIKEIYKCLPKDFYLPHQRNDKINNIIDG